MPRISLSDTVLCGLLPEIYFFDECWLLVWVDVFGLIPHPLGCFEPAFMCRRSGRLLFYGDASDCLHIAECEDDDHDCDIWPWCMWPLWEGLGRDFSMVVPEGGS
nr:hypothetical protein [Diaporthe pseudophoenicicola chrysovirus 1]